jgi:hypothetical protein
MLSKICLEQLQERSLGKVWDNSNIRLSFTDIIENDDDDDEEEEEEVSKKSKKQQEQEAAVIVSSGDASNSAAVESDDDDSDVPKVFDHVHLQHRTYSRHLIKNCYKYALPLSLPPSLL